MTLSAALVVGAMLTQAGLAAPPSSPDPQNRPIGTRNTSDQTLPVQKGMRIDLENCSGSVTVRTWNRSDVRVQASHNSRTRVRVTPRDQVVVVGAVSTMGLPTGVDFELSVPEWMGITADSPFCSADIEGVSGAVNISTVEGDISLRNLGGAAVVKTVEGDVTIEGSRGRVQVQAFEGDITVLKAAGELVIETIDGDIHMRDVTASAIEASTVDGDINYSGTFQPAGRYLFTTHDGDVRLTIPESSNVTFGLRTFGGGDVDSTISLKPVSSGSRGKRGTFTLGTGSAQVEVESFDGDIVIRRPGEKAQ